jgi:signal transduction histidine kinase
MFSRVSHREVGQKSRGSRKPLELVSKQDNSTNTAFLSDQECIVAEHSDIFSNGLTSPSSEFDRLLTVRESCDILSDSLMPDEIAQKALVVCEQIIPFEHGNILLNIDGNWKPVDESTELDFESMLHALEDRGIAESMFNDRSYNIVSVDELDIDESLIDSGKLLSFPMVADSKRIGVCLIYACIEESDFSRSDIEGIRIIISQAALAIRNRQIHDELAGEEHAHTDKQSWFMRSSRMAIVGEIARGLTHEINNPLQIILGKIQMASMGMGSQEVLKHIEGQALHIASLIRSLSEISKEGNGGHPDIIEVNSFIKNSVDVLKKQVEKKGIKILFQLKNESNAIHTDLRYLRLLILNSVLEAKKRMPSGGELCISSSVQENVTQIEFQYVPSKPQTVAGTGILRKQMGTPDYEETVNRLLAAEMGAMIEYRDDGITQGSRMVLCIPRNI